jgi:hypothetical protein
MKNLKFKIWILLIFILTFQAIIQSSRAQSPQKMSYQAVVRNSSNLLVVNQMVGMRISILQGSESGTAVYTETQKPTTNANGLVTLDIGTGTTSDDFSAIDWANGPYYIKTSTDLAGGTSYTISGVSQLLSVPYALYAKNVEIDKVDDADADPTNEIQVLSKTGNTVTLSKGGGSFTDAVDDADADPTNEIQIISKEGNMVTLSKSGGSFSVDDADADPTNEIQSLTLDGTTLSLNKEGGSVVIPGDNWGTQTVITDATLSGQGTIVSSLKIADSGVTSAKILDATIVESDLADNAVTTDKISAGAVTGAKIAQASASTGQALKWNGTTWAPANDVSGGLTLPYSGSYTNTSGFAFEIESHGITSIYSNGYIGLVGNTNADVDGISFGYGVCGGANQTSGNYTGVWGTTSSAQGYGVYGLNFSYGTNATGVYGESRSTTGIGISGEAAHTTGVNYGIKGSTSSLNGFSGYFSGGKFYTDAPVGIGTTSPNQAISVYRSTGNSAMNFLNSITGSTSTDGLFIGISGNSNYLWGYESYPLVLATNSTSRLYITSDGDIGVGSTAPAAKLHISTNSSSGYPHILLSESSTEYARLMFKNNTTTNNWIIAGGPWSTASGARLNFYYSATGDIVSITGDGKVGIGTGSPTQALHVVGNAYKTVGGTSWATSSDIRLKNLLGNYTKGLKEITALLPVRYVYKENNPRKLSSTDEQVGFVAQDVQKVFPEAVTEAEDGYLDFNIHAINVAVVNAIKELKIENDNLKAENELLKSKNEQIDSRLTNLEKLMGVSAMK